MPFWSQEEYKKNDAYFLKQASPREKIVYKV